MKPGGEASWLLTVYEKAARGIRAYSLPSEAQGKLQVKTPTLMEQALKMRKQGK